MGNTAAQTKAKLTAGLAGIGVAGAVMAGMGKKVLGWAGAAVTEFKDFEYLMKSVQAIAGEANLPAKALQETATAAKALGVEYGMLPAKVAESMFVLAKAGFETKAQLLPVTKAVLQLAASADEAPNTMADRLIGTLNTFKIGANRATVVADMLSKAANSAQIDVVDMFESIKYAGATASMLKVPFEDLLTSITLLGKGGIKGSMAGVSIQNMLHQLTKSVGPFATKAQGKALDLLGINPGDLLNAKGELKSILEIATIFHERTKNINTTAREGAFSAILGYRGGRAMVPLMENLKEYQRLKESVLRSGGSADDIAKKRLDSVAGAQKRYNAAVSEFKITAGAAFKDVLIVVLPLLTKMARVLSKVVASPFGKFILLAATGMMLLVGAVGALLVPFAALGIILINSKGAFAMMGTSARFAFNSIRNEINATILRLQIMMGMMAKNGMGMSRFPAGTMMGGKNVGGRMYNPGTFSMMGGGGGGGALTAGRIGFLRGLGGMGRGMLKLVPMLTKFAGIAFLLMGAFDMLRSFMTGQIGSGLGGLVGGIAGFMLGGPVGAAIGMGLGGMVGGMFDSDKPTPKVRTNGGNGSNESLRIGSDYSGNYSKNTSNANKAFYDNVQSKTGGTVVNIYQDGNKTLSRNIGNENEDIYLGGDLQ